MKIEDLGELGGQVVLFGGPYSNLQATKALIAAAGQAHLVCTGDTVAYCADPVGTVQALRDAGAIVLAGNVEKQLAAGALDCGCGFEEGTTCDLLSAGWFAHADAHVGPEIRKWMGTCPDVAVFTHHGRCFAVIHGGVSDISRFLWSTSSDAEFSDEIERLVAQVGPIDTVISGHSGIAFERVIGGVQWINAGVIGMPPNDGQPLTEYAVLEAGQVSFHRLTYDAGAARAAMEGVGLTQGYHAGLTAGYWPSEDVLPPDLRRGGSAANG